MMLLIWESSMVAFFASGNGLGPASDRSRGARWAGLGCRVSVSRPTCRPGLAKFRWRGRKFVRGIGAKCEKRRVFEVFGAKIFLPAGRNFPAKFRWPAGLMSWGGRATCGGRPRGFTLTPPERDRDD
jgi:hypothetical protein